MLTEQLAIVERTQTAAKARLEAAKTLPAAYLLVARACGQRAQLGYRA
jgi:hypothetical protein